MMNRRVAIFITLKAVRRITLTVFKKDKNTLKVSGFNTEMTVSDSIHMAVPTMSIALLPDCLQLHSLVVSTLHRSTLWFWKRDHQIRAGDSCPLV